MSDASIKKCLVKIEIAVRQLLKNAADKQLYLAELHCQIQDAEEGEFHGNPETARHFGILSELVNKIDYSIINSMEHETLLTAEKLRALRILLSELYDAIYLA